MFEFNTWVVNNLISGAKNGAFSKEWAAVQLANYYVRGKITEADIDRFEQETTVAVAVDESEQAVVAVDESEQEPAVVEAVDESEQEVGDINVC